MGIATLVEEVMREHGLTRFAAEELVEKSIQLARKKRSIAQRLEGRRSTSYLSFLKDASPEMDWDTVFAAYLAAIIDEVVAGRLLNVAISLPPRVGKSELVTKRLPVYWLERKPRDKVIVGAYNHTLARTFTSASLRIYKERNPSDMDTEAEDEWSNAYGGSVRAVGVGSGITGHGGSLILIDDPTKSIQEAFSKAYRDRVWNWYVSDLRTRRNDLAKTPTIVIATRWHRDDLIGRILQEADEGEWLEIRIPAIARENDPLGREVGESINPDRLPIKSLERERRLMGPRFDSLYQQDPIDEAGSMFDIDKIDRVLATPIEAHRVRFWDRAASVGAGDYTVGVLMAYDKEGVIWIEDIIRDRISKDAVRKRMKDTLVDDLERYGKNPAWSFKTYFEREPAGDGKTAAEDIIRDMAPYPIYSDRASDNKTARSAGFAVAVNASNVKMKIAPWNREFVDELARFVAGIDNKQDDQVDAASGAYNKLVIDNAIVTVR